MTVPADEMCVAGFCPALVEVVADCGFAGSG